MDETTTNEEATAEAMSEPAGAAGPTPEEPSATAGQDADAEGWAAQLQRMIDDVGRQALPVIREVAAKAAELAAVAGEKAGPIAQKAAEKTAELGASVAARGHDLATELRRGDGEDAAAPAAEAAAAAEATAEAGAPAAEASEGEAKGA